MEKDIKDILGYIAITILLLFIIVPPLFRVLFPKEDEIINSSLEEVTVLMNLECKKTDNLDGYNVEYRVLNNYKNSVITNSILTYSIEYLDDELPNVTIDEYEKLKRVENIDYEENDNVYVLTINYSNFDFSKEELLLDKQKMMAEQLSLYESEDFVCDTKEVK